MFRTQAVIFSFLLAGCSQSDAPVEMQTSTSALSSSTFALCGSKCGNADFYVGFGRTSQANVNDAQDTAAPIQDVVLPRTRNAAQLLKLQGAALDERRIDLENGTRASTVYRIETVRIGSLRKTETMVVEGTFQSAGVRAEGRFIWGDTFRVKSKSLKNGAPVRIRVARTMGGFGNPFTPDAFYDVRSKTALNGQVLTSLAYSIAKAPGVGETDVIVGEFQAVAELTVQVGVPFTLEGELSTVDGVRGVTSSTQQLNGGDAVDYAVSFVDGATPACLRSESGTFNAGSCN
jgi:hypothetical protein